LDWTQTLNVTDRRNYWSIRAYKFSGEGTEKTTPFSDWTNREIIPGNAGKGKYEKEMGKGMKNRCGCSNWK
jgi:hypothetical protein